MLRNRIEIGSEFWFEENLPQAVSNRDGVYVLSGRTAIDLIIQKILKTRKIQNVYMPAWCCDSMIQPFIDRGININLYDVRFDGELHFLIDKKKEADIFYITNYFGYETTLDTSIVDYFRTKGSVILYDRTHSFLMNDDSVMADYSFASIRKWMGVIGGAVVDSVCETALKQCPYLASKEKAMRMKRAYINGYDGIAKQEFLKLFVSFGRHLEDDYRDYAMDDLSYAIYKNENISEMKDKRRKNAGYLHSHLNLRFLSPLTKKAVPLFVPVLFESKERRDFIRKMLIEAEIFCPIHWPKNKLVMSEMNVNQIFDTELSLICDQRYDIQDMKRMIETIQSNN